MQDSIKMKILPDISDSKSASYSDEAIIGRSQPIKTYSHSENRAISWTLHLIACEDQDLRTNLNIMRALEACLYPKDRSQKTSYEPPPICKIKCGVLLGDQELCVVLKSYSVKFDPGVAWDESTLMPYKLDVDLSFETVYSSDDLPGADRIFQSGR